MSENRLFRDIPKTAEFHSAVLTTFSFDFHHFESQVLRVLKQKGVTNISVFADANMLDQSIGNNTGFLKSLSKAYSINGVSSTGAFHPKISFLAGEHDVMVLQGSGNITNGGDGKNHELFNVFYANEKDQSQLPFILETWQYLQTLVESISGLSNEKLDWIYNNCEMLQTDLEYKHQFHQVDDSFEAALLYNENESGIWDQLTNLLDPVDINDIKVFSPFYDENGWLINEMNQHFSAPIKAFLQPDRGIHPFKLNNDQVEYLSWESTDRAQEIFKYYNRKLHSKIFWFDAGKNNQYLLMGSPNATKAAFGTEGGRGVNDEFAVLIKTADQTIFDNLKLTGNYESITAQNNLAEKEIDEEHQKEIISSQSKVQILGMDRNEGAMKLYISSTKHNHLECRLYDAWGGMLEEVQIDASKSTIDFEIESNSKINRLSYVQLFHDGQPISNKQIINDLAALWNTNPSVANRRLMKLCSLIETGSNNMFDVVDYFNTIQSRTNSEAGNANHHSGNSDGKAEEEYVPNAGMSYEEAVELLNQSTEEKMLLHKQHSTVMVWDAIDRFFSHLAKSEEEEDMDDEEGGDATKSRDRIEKKSKPAEGIKLNSEKVLINRRKRIEKFLSNYSHAVSIGIEKDEAKLGLIDLAMFLIVMRQLLNFAELKVILSKNSSGEEVEENTVLLPFKGDILSTTNLSGALLDLIGHFTTLLYSKELEDYEDEYSIAKFEHYMMLTRRVSLFSLAAVSASYYYDKSVGKWMELLAMNIMHKLGLPHDDLSKHLDEFIKNTSILLPERKMMVDQINTWVTDFKAQSWKEDCIEVGGLGICKVTKWIPDRENPKFVKLSKPSFDYDEKISEFIYPDLFNINTGEFNSSLQSFKRSRA